MMRGFSAYFKRQAELFRINQNEIAENNLKLLQGGLICCCLVFVFLLLAGIFLPFYKETALISCCVFFIMSALLIAFRCPFVQRFATGGFYLVSAVLFVFAAYISLKIDVQQKTAVLIGLYGLFPLVVLDKSRRVNTAVLVSYLLYTMLAFLSKDLPIAVNDSVNCACFAAGGIFMGEYMRFIRLNNIDSKRRAQLKMETDFLTGLFNRRKLYESIKEEEENGSKQINTVLMLDIDHFKRYNDCYGHPAGDLCLQKIGALLKEFGESEKSEVFRYGGEEFVILMNTADSEEIYRDAEMLRSKIQELKITFPQYKESFLTLSIGFAVRKPSGNDTPEQLITKADEALYRAKSGGGNKVCGYLPQSDFSGKR